MRTGIGSDPSGRPWVSTQCRGWPEPVQNPCHENIPGGLGLTGYEGGRTFAAPGIRRRNEHVKRKFLGTASLIGILAVAGCHGSAGSAVGFEVLGPRGRNGAEGLLLNRRMGRVDVITFMGVLDAVLVQKYGLTMRRRAEQLNAAYYETEWAPREPSAEEITTGVTETRHRIVLQGHRLDSSTPSGSAVLFRMNLTIEHEVRTSEHPEWRPGPALDETFLDRMRALDGDLRAAAREALPQ